MTFILAAHTSPSLHRRSRSWPQRLHIVWDRQGSVCRWRPFPLRIEMSIEVLGAVDHASGHKDYILESLFTNVSRRGDLRVASGDPKVVSSQWYQTVIPGRSLSPPPVRLFVVAYIPCVRDETMYRTTIIPGRLFATTSKRSLVRVTRRV